jgi:hypothetical protein
MVEFWCRAGGGLRWAVPLDHRAAGRPYVALISGMFYDRRAVQLRGVALTSQQAAFRSMLDFLVWGAPSFVPMALIQYYMDKLVDPDPAPKKLPDGTYASAKLPANR